MDLPELQQAKWMAQAEAVTEAQKHRNSCCRETTERSILRQKCIFVDHSFETRELEVEALLSDRGSCECVRDRWCNGMYCWLDMAEETNWSSATLKVSAS